MKKSKRFWRTILAALVAVAFPLVMAGCGGGGEDTASPDDAVSTEAAPAAAPAAPAPAPDNTPTASDE